MSDRSSNRVFRWLQKAGLEKFYPKFKEKGVTEHKFMDLIVSDYQGLGISQLKDRQSLFKLIQYIKRKKMAAMEKRAAMKEKQAETPVPRVYKQNSMPGLSAPPETRMASRSAPTTPNPAPQITQRNEIPSLQKAKSQHDLHDVIRRLQEEAEKNRPARMDSNGSSMKYKSAERSHYKPRRLSLGMPDKLSHTAGSRIHEVQKEPENPEHVTRKRSASSDKGPKSRPNSAKSSTLKKSSSKKKSRMSRIKVCVRKRPLNAKELARGDKDVANVKGEQVIHIVEMRRKVDLTKYKQTHKFVFDAVFDVSMSNESVYEQTCKPLIDFFFQQGKATCFAYGQTGSGKTYTMMGPEGGKHSQTGLYVLAAKDMFQALKHYPQLELYVSFFEIYGGKFFDLLNGSKRLQLQEDAHGAVHTVGLLECKCECVDDLIKQIFQGNGARKTGGTAVHENSSRSHAVLQISAKTKKKRKPWGTYAFIDLAGSERAGVTQGSNRQRRIEGAEINKSLLALKECIRALDQKAAHLPFRGSKLTQVLKDSFVGNCRTVMIATVAPGTSSVENSLNTLRYADRVKEMKEKKGKKSSHNAYMPHSHANFNREDEKNPEGSSGDDEDEDEFDPNIGIPGRNNPSIASLKSSNLSQTWGGNAGSLASALAAVRKSSIKESFGKTTKRNTASNGRNSKGGIHKQQQPGNLRTRTGRASAVQPSVSTTPKPQGRPRAKSHIDEWPDPNSPRNTLVSANISYEKPGSRPTTAPTSTRESDQDSGFERSRTSSSKFEGNSKEDMQDFYQQICAQILEEEAALLDLHRRHIHDTMIHVKEEMELLKRCEAKRLSVDDYVDRLQEIHLMKSKASKLIQNKVETLKDHLKEEEILNKEMQKVQEKQHSVSEW